jgi:lipopolysaccharide/colanic/teichoic acid biosynthesis glycosyltransferase
MKEAQSINGIPRWKRRLDLALIILALPALVPLMIFIAILIRVSSAGPILFQQERVGFRGRKFMCLKFRTMICGADTTTHQGHLENLMMSDAPMIKMDSHGDSRIILPGKWLRASGLDELPQLINVLKSEMSIVGPRPCLSYEAEKYLPWQRERFEAAPGLTGLWQVSGKNQTTFVEMIRLDIRYARHKTFWLDLKIISKTVPALLVQMWGMKRRKKLSPAVTPQTVLRAR